MAELSNILILSDENEPGPSFCEISPTAHLVAAEDLDLQLPPGDEPTVEQLFPALRGIVENEGAQFEALFPSLDSLLGTDEVAGPIAGDEFISQPNEMARAEIGAASVSTMEPDSSSSPLIAAPVAVIIPW